MSEKDVLKEDLVESYDKTLEDTIPNDSSEVIIPI